MHATLTHDHFDALFGARRGVPRAKLEPGSLCALVERRGGCWRPDASTALELTLKDEDGNHVETLRFAGDAQSLRQLTAHAARFALHQCAEQLGGALSVALSTGPVSPERHAAAPPEGWNLADWASAAESEQPPARLGLWLVLDEDVHLTFGQGAESLSALSETVAEHLLGRVAQGRTPHVRFGSVIVA